MSEINSNDNVKLKPLMQWTCPPNTRWVRWPAPHNDSEIPVALPIMIYFERDWSSSAERASTRPVQNHYSCECKYHGLAYISIWSLDLNNPSETNDLSYRPEMQCITIMAIMYDLCTVKNVLQTGADVMFLRQNLYLSNLRIKVLQNYRRHFQ
jgi:hypothetical protein